MRVIAGICRGMKLMAPSGKNTRPTSDRVKEALFNIISSRFSLEGARILDICAGTGSLGIEALSRGAAFCSFVEHDSRILHCLEKNSSDSRIISLCEVISMDALKALSLFARRQQKYDMVLFDPPYDSALYTTVPELLVSLSLLASNALFVAESSIRKPMPQSFGRLIKFDRRMYGDTALEFFLMEGT